MVPSGLAGRNLIEEYEISRNVGLGIAVAGIGGVAGLGGRTRAYGWDWAEVAWLAICRGSIVSRGSTGSPPDAEVLQQYPVWVIFA